MNDPREPLGNAAAEFTALLGAVKTRAKKALGDQPLQADWSKQAEDVAATAAAAAVTALAGIATAAQTVGSVLDGWVQTHRADATDTTAGGDIAQTSYATGTPDAERLQEETSHPLVAPEPDAVDTALDTNPDAAPKDAPKHDEGVAWD